MTRRLPRGLLWVLAMGGVCAAAQPVFVSAPAGVRLQVAETTLDRAQLAETVLHVTLVNDGKAKLGLDAPGYAWLNASGGGGCFLRAAAASREGERTPRVLGPGERFAFTLVLRDVFCMDGAAGSTMEVVMQFRVESAASSGDAQISSAAIRLSGELADPLAIRFVLEEQQQWWNQGNIENFARGYKDSPDILFIGKTISRGYAQMLASYRRGYPTQAKMGYLTFSALEVQRLDERFATVTGRFALQRKAGDGGDDQGHFLLVMEKTDKGWKIVRDDTTEDAAPARP